MATVRAIAYKAFKRGLMHEVSTTRVTVSDGLVGERRGHGGPLRKRQVTVVSVQQWEETCRELGIYLPLTTRRANIYVDGLYFGPEDVGKVIGIGSLEMEVTGETVPCYRMDEQHPGLKAALSIGWRGGVTCRVRNGGLVAIGFPVVLL